MTFETLYNQTTDFLCCISYDGNIRDSNEQWTARLGYTRQQLEDAFLNDFLHTDDHDRANQARERASRHDQAQNFEARLLSAHGTEIWTAWSLRNQENGVITVVAYDIGDWVRGRQELDEQTRFLEMAASLASVGYWEYNPVTNETRWSKTLCDIHGVAPNDSRIGPELARSVMHSEDRKKVQALHANAWDSGEPFEYQARITAENGRARSVHSRAHCETTAESGEPALFFGVTQDITEYEQAIRAASHAATHDPLTKLLNRTSFIERISQALRHIDRYGGSVRVVRIDLDGFKEINDQHGHLAGDALLVSVAQRISAILKDDEVAARLNGDDFAVLQWSTVQSTGIDELCSRLMQVCEKPHHLNNIHLHPSCSMGIALARHDTRTADTLVHNAETALHWAKQADERSYRVFQQSMDEHLRDRLVLEADLKAAIEQDQFEMYLQPIVNTRTERLVSFEALLRWNSPTRGVVPPERFMSVAEQSGLIVPIGRWVIKATCQLAAQLPVPIPIAINISPTQFNDDDIVNWIVETLDVSGIEPKFFEIEVTETTLLTDKDGALAKLHCLREHGIKITIDDFGTGYSSLSYLRSFPFDKLKLDQSFVKDAANCPDDRAIVAAVASIAKALQIDLVAEGVETSSQLDVIRQEGYEQAQGYLFSRPLRFDQISTANVAALASGQSA